MKMWNLQNLCLAALVIALPMQVTHANNKVKKVAGYTVYSTGEGKACQANLEDKEFDFCGKKAISAYSAQAKASNINFAKNLVIVKFNEKQKLQDKKTYLFNYLAAVNPATHEVFPFPYRVGYSLNIPNTPAAAKYPEIIYNKNKSTICSNNAAVAFDGDSVEYKSWGGDINGIGEKDGSSCFTFDPEDKQFSSGPN